MVVINNWNKRRKKTTTNTKYFNHRTSITMINHFIVFDMRTEWDWIGSQPILNIKTIDFLQIETFFLSVCLIYTDLEMEIHGKLKQTRSTLPPWPWVPNHFRLLQCEDVTFTPGRSEYRILMLFWNFTWPPSRDVRMKFLKSDPTRVGDLWSIYLYSELARDPLFLQLVLAKLMNPWFHIVVVWTKSTP